MALPISVSESLSFSKPSIIFCASSITSYIIEKLLMLIPSLLDRDFACEFALTLKPNILASEVIASVTSDSLISPTVVCIIFISIFL